MKPSVIAVKAINQTNLIVEFDNGEVGALDMEPYLDFGVFSNLKDEALFKQVQVSFDTIEWPGGIDLSPEFVYQKTNISK